MDTTRLQDRIVLEICSEKEVSFDFLADTLYQVADRIKDGCKGDNYTDEDIADPNDSQEVEVLWEHECPRYGCYKIVGDKSLIRQYYYHSELAPRIITEQTSKEIGRYLDSFVDAELSHDEMAELFRQAKELLTNVRNAI